VTKLLILEDDPLMQTLLVMVFQHAGYEVLTAMADEVIPSALDQPAILVVGCDGRGTFEIGWRVAEQLRRQLPAATMIMLSTSAAAVGEVGQTARGCLFDAGLRKPFSVPELLACVATCHARRSHHPGPCVAA
jgi:DNA-binding response OmpR family regulator